MKRDDVEIADGGFPSVKEADGLILILIRFHGGVRHMQS